MEKKFIGNNFTATFTDKDGYFSLTGHTNGMSGAVGDELTKIDPRFKLINNMHLSNCKTGAPMHAWANAKYFMEEGDEMNIERLKKHLRHNIEEYMGAFIDVLEAQVLVKDISGYEKRCVIPEIMKLDAVKAEIEELWREDAKEVYDIINRTPSDLTEIDENNNLNDYNEPKKVQALAQHLNCHFSLVEESEYGSDYFEAEGKNWLVVTNDEAEELWDKYLDNYLDDCVLPEIPENMQNYFDTDSWKQDARMDGRGHSLSSYDGCEHFEDVDGTTYYIYRQ